MNKLKLFLLTFIVALTVASFNAVTFAADAITIDSVIFDEYVDDFGSIDASLVNVSIGFTAVSAPEQVSLLLASEDIAEISNATKNKIIYMTQEITPVDGLFNFAIEKSKIQSATGLAEIDGCTLYVKIGGKDVAEMATEAVIYNDPEISNVIPGDVDGDGEVTNLDGTYLLRYLADWKYDNLQLEAMDVDADGEITNLDGTFLLRYLAGWDIELK